MNTLRWLRREARPALRPSCSAVGRGVRLAFALSPLLACGDGTGPEASVIGVRGGTASLAGGAISLSVPGGALTRSVEFTAERTTAVPLRGVLLGSAYEVGPAGTSFAALATLTIPYDSGSLPVGVRQAELRLQQVVGAGWQPTIGSSVDSARHMVTGQIQGLGRFGVVAILVDSLVLTPSRYTVAAGLSTQLIAEMRGRDGEWLPDRRLTWTSTDQSVATVDTLGVATGVGAGITTITASVEGLSATAAVSVYDCSKQTSISTKECLALIAVYDGISQFQWRSTYTWVVASADPCRWLGVSCEGGSVSELRLYGFAHPPNSGPIPNALGDLAGLTLLDLSHNHLSGSIPSSLGSLTKLEALELEANSLTGPIPPELGRLSKLQAFHANDNQLTGSIPADLGHLSALTDLSLNRNELSGPIPPELGNLANLQGLNFMGNRLSGPIPTQLGGLANLQTLDLSINELTGGIPKELGNLSNLTDLHLGDNHLSGSIPAEIGNLSNLQFLRLYRNQLTGAVPLSVAQLGGKIQVQYRPNCLFVMPGPPEPGSNTGLSIPDEKDFRDADRDADGLICELRIGSP